MVCASSGRLPVPPCVRHQLLKRTGLTTEARNIPTRELAHPRQLPPRGYSAIWLLTCSIRYVPVFPTPSKPIWLQGGCTTLPPDPSALSFTIRNNSNNVPPAALPCAPPVPCTHI